MVGAQILNIPDPNFKAKLLAADTNNTIAHAIGGGYMRVDFNNDGEIQLSEATFIDSLNVNNANIADLTGILSFNNLKGLQCANNQLTALNLNNLTGLKKLFCGSNNLGSLDLSGLGNLEFVSAYTCNLNSINLSGLTGLKLLEVGDNQITSLNLNSIVNLEELRCGTNQLTSLDLSPLTTLKRLACWENQLTSLDLNGLTLLESLDCFSNQLTTLDLNQHTSLQRLDCGNNNLSSIFIKNGAQGYFRFGDNLNLRFICADEFEIAGIQFEINNDPNLINCVVNSYCTTTPGGNYNTISGDLTFDENGDGCDSNDLKLQNVRVNVSDGINSSAIFTNNSGVYKTYAQVGNFQLTPIIENPPFFNITPTTANISFGNSNNNISSQNFCISPNGLHTDVAVIISPIITARPGFDAVYELVYRNKGNKTEEISVNLAYNESLLDVISSTVTPTQSNVGEMSWVIPNVKPFQSGSISITFKVNSPMDTPAVNIGDTLSFTASSSTSEVDEMPVDNTFMYQQTVVGSFDPNDKTCLEGNIVSPENIGKYLHYSINFENTGTAAAEKIVVKDIIDTTKFDLSTLQILSISHPATTKITGNTVELMFDNINLAPAAHGNIVFKIKTKNNLTVGSTVSNKAEIYFDYNFPIETNTATSIFQTLSNVDFDTDLSVRVFPNPAKNKIDISANESIKSIQLFDEQGREMSTNLVNEIKSTLDISSYSKGIYFLKIQTNKGIKTEKIIKE